MSTLGVILATATIGGLTYLLVVPYMRLELRRRSSRRHVPQPEEIWMQDEQLLYIDAVTPLGVELMTFDPQSKQFNRWRDTWGEWQTRLQLRSVWFTGMRRPLGPYG